MFPLGFLDRLDPSYRKELAKLQDKIDAIKTKKNGIHKILELLYDFSSNLLMPKQFWDEMLKIAKGFPNVDKLELAEISIYHLSYLSSDRTLVPFVHDEKLWFDDERVNSRLIFLRRQNKKPLCIENFCYPHKNLEKKWKAYEKNALAFIPKAIHQRYEKSKILYSRLQSINRKNYQELFKTIAEAEDVEFVEQNVEFLIGMDLSNKALWKIYIAYLQENDQKKLLETYSKYCRFFIDDFEMFKEYQKATENFGPSKVPWKNTFNFEIYDKSVLCVFKSITTSSPVIISKCTSYFDVENVLAQKFPFHPKFMEYIIKNAKAEILFNLFQCCKWFFARYSIPICYKFEASRCVKNVHQQLQSVFIKDVHQYKLDMKLFVSFGFYFTHFDFNALSKFIPKIYRCTAKHVKIEEQNLTMNELKFLIGHGNVLNLRLFYVKDQDGNQFAFEDILQLVPKIEKLNVYDTKCPDNFSQYLCNFPFQNKIEEFKFGEVKVVPDPYGFAEFILKNASTLYCGTFTLRASKNANGNIVWDEEDENEEVSRFMRIVKEILNQQGSDIPKPSLMFY